MACVLPLRQAEKSCSDSLSQIPKDGNHDFNLIKRPSPGVRNWRLVSSKRRLIFSQKSKGKFDEIVILL